MEEGRGNFSCLLLCGHIPLFMDHQHQIAHDKYCSYVFRFRHTIFNILVTFLGLINPAEENRNFPLLRGKRMVNERDHSSEMAGFIAT